jgi:hypothetical protein
MLRGVCRSLHLSLGSRLTRFVEDKLYRLIGLIFCQPADGEPATRFSFNNALLENALLETRLEFPHASCAPLPRDSNRPPGSGNYWDSDCRTCSLESDSGALRGRRVVEGKHVEYCVCNFDRVWHAENMAHFGRKVGMDSPCSVVYVWAAGQPRQCLG